MSAEVPRTFDVAITGAGGQIGSLVGREVLSGDVFGERTIVNLHLLEAPGNPKAMQRLGGVAMELEDLASPNLGSIDLEDDPKRAFAGVDFAFFVGAMPRGRDMQRADLLEKNGHIFKAQGEALAEADDDVRVLVVGNPANSNALVTLANAPPDMPPEHVTAMSRLDHNRAVASLARKLGVKPDEIEGLVIWGNHSDTMVADISRVTVNGEPLPQDLVSDPEWNEEFAQGVANRGAAIIQARETSSAMSAAKAAADHARDWVSGSYGDIVSMAVLSHGEYDTPAGVVSSFPVTTEAPGELTIVEGLELPEGVKERIAASGEELVVERRTLQELGLLAVA